MNSFTTYRNQRYFKSLDGVRFFSILAVVWHHATPPNLPEVFSRGFLGVDMFFVLSGYLIVTLLLREKDRNNQKISLKNFYIRRALRIFPVYFGVLFALSVIYGLLKPEDPDTEKFFSVLPFYLGFVANWSLIHAANLGIYWSLATEEQFYLVWPLLEKICKPKLVLWVLGLFLVFNQAINFAYLDSFFAALYGLDKAPRLEILDATFTPICLGVLLAHALHQQRTFLVLHRLLKHSFSSLLGLVFLLAVITLFSEDVSGLQRLIIQLVMVLWLASLVVREEHILQPLMTFPLVKRLGQISYGMYVYHMMALHVVREVLIRLGVSLDYWLFTLCLVLTVVIAELSFRWYESPILSLSKKYKAL